MPRFEPLPLRLKPCVGIEKDDAWTFCPFMNCRRDLPQIIAAIFMGESVLQRFNVNVAFQAADRINIPEMANYFIWDLHALGVYADPSPFCCVVVHNLKNVLRVGAASQLDQCSPFHQVPLIAVPKVLHHSLRLIHLGALQFTGILNSANFQKQPQVLRLRSTSLRCAQDDNPVEIVKSHSALSIWARWSLSE